MSFGEIVAYALASLLVIVLCCIFFKPLKSLFVMILHSALGGAGIYICNLALASFGAEIGLNIVTASVCGLLGLPGLILLLLLKLLFAFV